MIITATPGTDATSVDLLVTAIPATTALLVVWRSYNGVRDAVKPEAGSAISGSVSWPVNDADAPLGWPITYTAYAYSATGALLGQAQADPITLVSEVAVISDPLAPGTQVRVVLSGYSDTDARLINDSLQEISHDTPGQVLRPIGSSLGIGMMGVTEQGSQVTLQFAAPTEIHSAMIRTLLMIANPFLLRYPKSAGKVWSADVPPLAYVQHASWSTIKVHGERDHIVVSGALVMPPAGPIVVNKRTYADLLVEHSTYGSMATDRPDYLSVWRGA